MKTAQYIKALTVALRPEIFDQVKKITDDKKISMADFVREAIDAALKQIERKEKVINDN